MRILKPLVIFLIMICSQFSYSQQQDGKPILLNSISEPTYEELARDIDYLVVEISKTPNAIGYIVVFAGSDNIENAFYKIAVIKSIKFRGFNDKKLTIITAAGTEKPKIEYWISNVGTKPNIQEENFSFKLPTDKAINFADDLLEIVNVDGKKDYYSVGCDTAGCIGSADFNILSSFLDSNPEFNSFVIVHAKNITKAQQIKKLMAKRVYDEIGISSQRLIFLYGGENETNVNNFFEIEVYLASNILQLPKTKSTITYKKLF